ncbi:hypothetical protein EB118_01675 [bacterium]|nr:hypothetical protein [bacterium]NBX97959.1 hypothetical protein [bacterium]NDC94410.1 hypothetical protein [bacterium]NDD83796.1 hypothetical protein [bacterium]NDG28797.1 hypothetical protein [bacterium]
MTDIAMKASVDHIVAAVVEGHVEAEDYTPQTPQGILLSEVELKIIDEVADESLEGLVAYFHEQEPEVCETVEEFELGCVGADAIVKLHKIRQAANGGN